MARDPVRGGARVTIIVFVEGVVSIPVQVAVPELNVIAHPFIKNPSRPESKDAVKAKLSQVKSIPEDGMNVNDSF